ncbi:Conjugative transfer signal peptidase TraF [Ectopseudomonas oleovorans]|jgi:type IV secretory pathway protease TraF|uniref:Conjugative transfer signal peptidase TraF n=1 Tax=Ectopseudomonas oleovorans TaxID=301 RepID=A0A653B0E8_ECTOL|nr:Conjugative transfer signal peptidase TraF [Pseudomonas oleovorans]
MTPGTHQAWRPLTLPSGSIFAMGWATLATPPPQLVYNTSDNVSAGLYRTSPANAPAPSNLMVVHLPPEAMQWLRNTATC